MSLRYIGAVERETESPMEVPTDRPAPLGQSKPEWRAWLIESRQAMPPDVRRRAERQIADTLTGQAVLRGWQSVSVFLPWRGEPDLVVVWRAWHQRGVALSLPVVVGASAPLVFRSWRPGQPLVKDLQGLMTPDQSRAMDCPVWIIPCVGVDARGARLGAGKGYFDRTLAARRAAGLADPFMVGVLFQQGALNIELGQVHDLRLQAWVHEGGWCQPEPLSPSR
jgi:5,10-methenyltetrahydrofolate synthetase